MADRPWLSDADPKLGLERELLQRLAEEGPSSTTIEQGWTTLAAELSALPAMGAAAASAAEAAHGLSQGASASAASGSFVTGGLTGSTAAAGTSASAVGTGAAGTAASGTGLLTAAKVAIGVALTGGAVWTGAQLASPDEVESVKVVPTTPAVVETRAPVERKAAPPKSVERVEAPRQAPAQRPQTATSLAKEGQLLAKANQLFQAGRAREALEVLTTMQARYPRSTLYQEREVLTIEALSATGAAGAAKSRAERFIKRYPTSPHAERLRRFAK